jgi:hypothetical protein
MAKGRRPPDLRQTLGTLMQTALEQVGVVREVVEREAQAQLSRLDLVKLQRQRRNALAELGEAVYDLAVQGKLGELSEAVRECLAAIDAVDQQLEGAGRPGDRGFAANSGWRRPPKSPARRDDAPIGVWRPVPPFAAPDQQSGGKGGPDQASAPRPSGERSHHSSGHESSLARRSTGGRAPAGSEPAQGGAAVADEPRPRPGRAIRFDDNWDDDDDLEEYMHENDVPAGPSGGHRPTAPSRTKND